jgi:hypothetical protein
MDQLSHNERIALALDSCESSSAPNYSAIAREFMVERTTLAKRHKGQTVSRAEANSVYRQLLTNAQEEQLVKQINKLTVRHMPPTVQMVKNMAEEIIQREVNKNWTSGFVKRHKHRLKSLYLRNIDNLRAKSEYAPMFQHFYDLVSLLLYYYYLPLLIY